jgi:hypothetical protein
VTLLPRLDVAHKSPHHARAFANLGVALATACRGADAQRALEVALALDPGHVQAAINLRLLQSGTLEAKELANPGRRCLPWMTPSRVAGRGAWCVVRGAWCVGRGADFSAA